MKLNHLIAVNKGHQVDFVYALLSLLEGFWINELHGEVILILQSLHFEHFTESTLTNFIDDFVG